MQRILKSLGSVAASVVFTVGFFVSQGACCSLYHQPDMPEEMAKHFQ